MHTKRRFGGAFALVGLLMLPFTVPSMAQAAPVNMRDVVYGEAGGQQLRLDVYGADKDVTKPALVFVHGGGWSGGSKDDFALAGAEFAKNGYVCFSVGYRLLDMQGGNRFPAQIDDVQRAVRWIRAHAAEYGVNSEKIGATGISAGGHLVALLGTTDTRDNSDPELAKYSSRVQCVVDICGPTDFTAFIDEAADVPPEFAWVVPLLQELLGKLPEAADMYRAASPIQHIDEKTVPFLIFHGDQDQIVSLDQSISFDKALREANIESKLVVFKGEGHGFAQPQNINQVFMDSLAFFDRHLKE